MRRITLDLFSKRQEDAMHARVATFEEGDVDRAEGLSEERTDRLRAIIEGIEGWQGMLRLIDRGPRTQMLVHLL